MHSGIAPRAPAVLSTNCKICIQIVDKRESGFSSLLGRAVRNQLTTSYLVSVLKWLELRRLPQILFYLRSGAYGDFQKSESAPKGYTT